MNKNNIDYIVSCYLGERRLKMTSDCNEKDKLFFLKQHINAINNLKVDNIKNIIFSINSDDPNDEKLISNFVKNVECKINVKYIINQNKGFSYAAWETAIKENINDKSDYYFLIEDDQLPITDYFYNYFIDKITPYTGYVCELVFQNHASIPHGIIRGDICRKILKEKNILFDINRNAKTYKQGENNQRNFLNFLLEKGYLIKDIIDIAKIEHINHHGKMLTFGNINRNKIISPLYC